MTSNGGPLLARSPEATLWAFLVLGATIPFAVATVNVHDALLAHRADVCVRTGVAELRRKGLLPPGGDEPSAPYGVLPGAPELMPASVKRVYTDCRAEFDRAEWTPWGYVMAKRAWLDGHAGSPRLRWFGFSLVALLPVALLLGVRRVRRARPPASPGPGS